MNVVQKFIDLTKRTYPHGTEELLLNQLPRELEKDPDGNYFLKIGESKTIFACHLDTVSKTVDNVVHVIDGEYIKTNGKTILGADDKAGVVILLYLISKKIPGLYYFFLGEEVGCIGSTAAAKRKKDFKDYNKMISFDRKNVSSVITYQSSLRCCSDDFANSLISEFAKSDLKFEKDEGGVYTDSAEFVEIIPECTNISVGYFNEHTVNEKQNIFFLEKLCRACVSVEWEKLSIKRNPSVKERRYKYNSTVYTANNNYSNNRNTTPNYNKNKSSSNESVYYGDSYNSKNYKKRKRTRKYKNNEIKYDEYEIYNEHGILVSQKNNLSSFEGNEYNQSKNIYEPYISYFFDDDFTSEEVKLIKEQIGDYSKNNPDFLLLEQITNSYIQ